MLKRALCVAAILAWSPAQAGLAEQGMRRVFELFCIKLLDAPMLLRRSADEVGTRMRPDQASPFLGPSSGHAWIVSPIAGVNVVLMHTDDGACAAANPLANGHALQAEIASRPLYRPVRTTNAPDHVSDWYAVVVAARSGPDFRALVSVDRRTVGDRQGSRISAIPERLLEQMKIVPPDWPAPLAPDARD